MEKYGTYIYVKKIKFKIKINLLNQLFSCLHVKIVKVTAM